MNWSRAKTILICCLLAINGILLGYYLLHQGQLRRLEQENQEHLRQVLLRQGVDLSETAALPDSQTQGKEILLRRDAAQEQRLACALLNQEGLQENGGLYQGGGGSLRFRGGGYLDLIQQEPVTEQTLHAAFGAVPEDAGGRLPQYYDGVPIYNSGVTVSDPPEETALTGRWVTGAVVASSRKNVRSMATVLVCYAEKYGGQAPTIEAVEQGYVVRTTAPEYLQLAPVWHIVTDQGEVYFSAVTGEEEALAG